MATVFEDTTFAQHIVRTLISYGQLAERDVLEYGESEAIPYAVWCHVKENVDLALHLLCKSGKPLATSLFLDIFRGVSEGASGPFIDLSNYLQRSQLPVLYESLLSSEDGRYCMAACLLSAKVTSMSIKALEAGMYALAGVVVAHTNDIRENSRRIASVLFGEHWCALFSNELEDHDVTVWTVIGQRPPFVSGAVERCQVDVPMENMAP